MCVKNTAFSCSVPTPSCDSRIVVPRPASNCNFTAPQLLLSSPERTSVPAEANPVNGCWGPPAVPVKVTITHGAACAVATLVKYPMLATSAVANVNRFISSPLEHSLPTQLLRLPQSARCGNP